MELEQVKGLGPKKIEALRSAGIATAQDLAGIDLRRTVEVDGVSKDALKQYKQRARQALRSASEEIPKAPYRTNGKGNTGRSKAPARKEPELTTKPKKQQEKPKRGLLRRLLRK